MTTIQKKVCLLGDFAVGKTSLVQQFVKGRFDDKYLSTIGVKISRKTLTRLPHTVNLLLWDLAGGNEYDDPESGYLHGAAGAIVVCDLTRHDTIYSLERYTEQVGRFNANAAVVIVANKLDLPEDRTISEEELNNLSQKLPYPLILSSAKTGVGVNESFESLLSQMEQSNLQNHQ